MKVGKVPWKVKKNKKTSYMIYLDDIMEGCGGCPMSCRVRVENAVFHYTGER